MNSPWKPGMVLLMGLCVTGSAFLFAGSKSEACKKLLDSQSSDAGQKPPALTLSPTDVSNKTLERACLKSYGSGFPGGEEAFLKADSYSLRKDLDHLEKLFQSEGPKTSLPSGKDPDYSRKAHILVGWDRDQVLLWGNFFYIRRLSDESKFREVVTEAARVRRTLGLDVHPLKHWDNLEGATYFSKQSLRNMIVILEYQARSRTLGNDEASRAKLAEEFIANRDALKPFFDFAGDPTKENLDPYCHPVLQNDVPK